MNIVVIGGHGLIGSRVVERLRDTGHQVTAASRRTGVDTLTGAGLVEALAAAEVVVDASNAPSFDAPAVVDFFQRSTANLLAACAQAGVGHFVALSVVGTPYLQGSDYFRAKAVQEQLVLHARLPATLVRATQCFEFMAQLIPAGAEREPVHLPVALVQPLAADDLGEALSRLATAPLPGGVVEIGGPERHRLFELVEWVMYFHQDNRPVVGDRDARYYGAALKELTLTPGAQAIVGTTRFADWLGRHTIGQLPHVNQPDPLR